MCRFVIYKGTAPVQLSHVSFHPYSRIAVVNAHQRIHLCLPQLLTRPCHSIVNQAFGPRLRLDPRRPINGDGFGVGWYDSVYDEELGAQPCIFTSSTPVSDTHAAFSGL